jgi:hypothetical protein
VYFCVLCLIVVPLPPGKNPFAVQLSNNNNNNNNKNNNTETLDFGVSRNVALFCIHLCVSPCRLHYVNAVITEVMRINPAVAMTIPHRVVQDTTLNGYTIPKVRPSELLVTTFLPVQRHQ